MREGPRFAAFRSNAGLANAPLLPFDTFMREEQDGKRKYLVIGHGYQSLNFIVIGAPKPRSKFWVDRTDNLLMRAAEDHSISKEVSMDGDAPPPEPEVGGDIEINLDLVEHLQKQMRETNG
jgi:hypothetical protein